MLVTGFGIFCFLFALSIYNDENVQNYYSAVAFCLGCLEMFLLNTFCCIILWCGVKYLDLRGELKQEEGELV
jgi:nucleoside recognition membrane protein YjiH